jgi:hypothetical protein
MNKTIVFHLERVEPVGGQPVRATITGKREEVASMIFAVMDNNAMIKELLLKVVAGYLVVNNISINDFKQKYF